MLTRSPARAQSLAGLCAICGQFGRGAVCDACNARWRRPFALCSRCPRCALAWPARGDAESGGSRTVCGACVTAPPAFDAALAAVDYAWPWDRLVTRFKFHGAFELAALFANDLVDVVRSRDDADAGGTPDQPDLLLPVPLAPLRLAERGANQAWQITRRLAATLGIAADPALLVRIRETPHQLDLPLAERAGNVRAAFALDPLGADRVHGRHVAVIDDVMTTGHTLAAIATLLKRHGARRVSAWTWARTPAPDR